MRVVFAENMRGAGKERIIYTYCIISTNLSRLCNMKMCSKQKFAVLTLIIGSSKAFAKMAVTEG